MNISPLGSALGAEVEGLDLSNISAAQSTALIDAFLEYHLLCIRAEPLSSEEFAAFARRFGTPQIQLIRKKRADGIPEVSVLESTYKSAKDKPNDLEKVRLSHWHTDDSYFAKPAKATLLQGLNVPDSGGHTRFSNTRLAWDELPSDKQALLAPLKAVHGYDTPRAPARAEARTAEEAAETPDVVHPLIRTHDDTGRKSIYFNPNRTDHIVDMPREESDALLDELYTHITQPHLQYHHEWRAGDILVWDNRCLVHSVNTDFPVGQRRRHQRILLQGSMPV